MDFSNSTHTSQVSSFTSWDTPQYNGGSWRKNIAASPKSTLFDDTKPQTVLIYDNVTTIVQVSKKVEDAAQEKALFYVYGDRKNGLLNDIAEVLAGIVQEKEATAFVSITNLKSNIGFCEDVDLEIGKY